jgi:hypothetical protein
MSLILANAVALGLCTETSDEEVAAEQLSVAVHALETRVLEAETKVAEAQAKENVRLDTRLAEIRRQNPFLSLEQCSALLEFDKSIT